MLIYLNGATELPDRTEWSDQSKRRHDQQSAVTEEIENLWSLLAYLLTYLLTCLLHGAESFLRS